MNVGPGQILFDQKHTKILEFADTLEGDGMSPGSFNVADIEKGLNMFDACERMAQLISHSCIENISDDDGGETGRYTITSKGREALNRAKRKLERLAAQGKAKELTEDTGSKTTPVPPRTSGKKTSKKPVKPKEATARVSPRKNPNPDKRTQRHPQDPG